MRFLRSHIERGHPEVFEISAFLSIFAGGMPRAQEGERWAYLRQRETHPQGHQARKKGGALGGSRSTWRAGRETDLFITNIPNHERPEEIAGQRDPPHIAPIVQHVIVVVV
jgi:hypothetical protein